MLFQIPNQKKQSNRDENKFKILLIFLGFFFFLTVETKANYFGDQKIYKLCERRENKIGILDSIASDNVSLFLLYNNKINSIDIQTFEKNWESSYSGEILNNPVISKENLTFTTKNTSELQNGVITTTVLNSKSGIPISIKRTDVNVKLENKDLNKAKIEKRLSDLNINTSNIKSRNLGSLSISKWVEENKNIFVGFKNGSLIHFDWNTNSFIWETKMGGEITNLLLIPQGLLVTSNDNFMYLFDRKDANKIWKKRLSGRTSSIYLLSESEVILQINDSEYLLQINLKDGSDIGKILKTDKSKLFRVFQTAESDLILISDAGLYRYSTNNCKK